MRIITTGLMVLGLCSLLACGNSGSGSGGGSGAGGGPGGAGGGGGTPPVVKPGAPDVCEDAWVQYVAGNPAGAYRIYHIVSTSSMDGRPTPQRKSVQKTEVLESSNERVVSKVATDGRGYKMTMMHDEFVANCKERKPGTSSFGQVVANAEQVTVPAGVFTTTHYKMNTQSEEMRTATIETWVATPKGYPLTVKTAVVMAMESEGRKITQTQISVLVEYK